MWIELDDELFPPRSSLVSVEFASDEDFARAHAWHWDNLDRYAEVYAGARTLVIRQTDVPALAALGLQFTAEPLFDWESLPREEANRLLGEIMREAFPRFVESLRQRS